MRCAVLNCCNSNNNNKNGKKLSFYVFPKDEELLQKWVGFCGRTCDFSSKNSRVCSEHFKPEDFERNMQMEMGLTSKKSQKLKPGTVPSLKRSTPFIKDGNRKVVCGPTSYPTGARKAIVAVLLVKPTLQPPTLKPPTLKPPTLEPPTLLEPTCVRKPVVEVNNEDVLTEKLKLLEETAGKLRTENIRLKDASKKVNGVLKSLNERLQQTNSERNNTEKVLRKMFTAGQLKHLASNDKRQVWSKNDITESITLYAASSKVYALLRRKQFPLPAIRTLQNWMQKINGSEKKERANKTKRRQEIKKHKSSKTLIPCDVNKD